MKIADPKFSEEEKPSFYDIKIDDEGNVSYYNEKGKLHRLNGPATEWADGNKAWFINNKLHRLDGPAIEWADGTKQWYYNGKRHRLDGPATEWADGTKWWFTNNKLHRLDGPAVEYANGCKEWYVNNKLIGKSKEGFTQEDFERWKKERGYESSQLKI
jgi:hypothetical protein